MHPTDARPQVEAELQQAENARSAGDEGRARVCARRAAGAAARAYLSRLGLPAAPSVLDNLHLLSNRTDLPARIQTGIQRLLLRVNAEYRLPAEIDLIQEARLVSDHLLQITPSSSGEAHPHV